MDPLGNINSQRGVGLEQIFYLLVCFGGFVTVGFLVFQGLLFGFLFKSSCFDKKGLFCFSLHTAGTPGLGFLEEYSGGYPPSTG